MQFNGGEKSHPGQHKKMRIYIKHMGKPWRIEKIVLLVYWSDLFMKYVKCFSFNNNVLLNELNNSLNLLTSGNSK